MIGTPRFGFLMVKIVLRGNGEINHRSPVFVISKIFYLLENRYL